MYSVEQKKHLHLSDFGNWTNWVNFVNNNERFCLTLNYRDFANHKISDLPSCHPYWKFKCYLQAKQRFIDMVKTLRQYRALLMGGHENSNISFQIEQLEKAISTNIYSIYYKMLFNGI